VEPHDGPVERDVVLVEVVDGVLATTSFDTLLTMLCFGIFQSENGGKYDLYKSYFGNFYFKVSWVMPPTLKTTDLFNCPLKHCFSTAGT
jgi:hypothetical protein